MNPTLAAAVVLAALLAMPASAAQPARQALDRFAEGLRSLEGDFEQLTYGSDGGLRETARGTVSLQAPRLFRWAYRSPYQQLVVADGSHVWLHDVDLEQVTVRRQADQEAQSPLVVLTDPDSLDRRYRVAEDGNTDGLDWLLLVPLDEDDGFRSARLGLGAEGLERMLMEDALGGRSEIRFSGWRRNPELPPERFRFRPPEGVDLIGDVDSVAEIRPLGDPN